MSLAVCSKLRREPMCCPGPKPCAFFLEKSISAPSSQLPEKKKKRKRQLWRAQPFQLTAGWCLAESMLPRRGSSSLTFSPTPALHLRVTVFGAPLLLPFPKVQSCSFSGSACSWLCPTKPTFGCSLPRNESKQFTINEHSPTWWSLKKPSCFPTAHPHVLETSLKMQMLSKEEYGQCSLFPDLPIHWNWCVTPNSISMGLPWSFMDMQGAAKFRDNFW